jgi:hypothetical protein
MTKFYISLLFSSILCSCGLHIDYLGTTGEPTERIDVFVDPTAIKRPYTIVGKGYPDRILGDNTRNLQPKAIRIAKEKGADAILFQDLYETESHSAVYSTFHGTDSSGKNHFVARNNTTSPVVSARVDILFLKYND